MDANAQVLEQAKCLLGIVQLVERRQRYKEHCVIGAGTTDDQTIATTTVDYGADAYARLFESRDRVELLDRAIAFVDGAQFALLQREPLARYHAARATLLSHAARMADAGKLS